MLITHTPNLEVSARTTACGRLLFVMNHMECEQELALNGRYCDRVGAIFVDRRSLQAHCDMLNGETPVSGTITLPAKAVSILLTAA